MSKRHRINVDSTHWRCIDVRYDSVSTSMSTGLNLTIFILYQKVDESSHEGQQIIASKFWRTRLTKISDDQKSASDRPHSSSSGDVKMTTNTMRSVMASLNKMAILRQRTMVNKGNVTRSTPFRNFVPSEVEKEMERIVSTAIKGVVYDPKRSGVLARSLSDTIKGKLKNMKLPRYKFVCMVTIVDKTEPSLVIGSRCLWNDTADNYVTVEISNPSLVAIATVYAILQE